MEDHWAGGHCHDAVHSRSCPAERAVQYSKQAEQPILVETDRGLEDSCDETRPANETGLLI